jgi:hypothetical protein
MSGFDCGRKSCSRRSSGTEIAVAKVVMEDWPERPPLCRNSAYGWRIVQVIRRGC